MRLSNHLLVLVLTLGAAISLRAQEKKKLAATDPSLAGGEFAIQGECVAALALEGKPGKYGIQVIALGSGKFQAAILSGGLPGAGWEKKTRLQAPGEWKEGQVVFGGILQGTTIRDGV